MARFIFHAQRMLDRIIEEGKQDLLDEKTRQFILSLDGAEGTDYNWEMMVKGNELVYLPDFNTYVNQEDCDPI